MKLSPQLQSVYPFNSKIRSIMLTQFMYMLSQLVVN